MFVSIALLIIYVMCSALGLILLKMGINAGAHVEIGSMFVDIKFHTHFILGAILYIFSFLLNTIVMSRFDLSFVYPLSAGMIYIAILLLSVMLLKENISMLQFIGMLAILLGIVLMNLKK